MDGLLDESIKSPAISDNIIKCSGSRLNVDRVSFISNKIRNLYIVFRNKIMTIPFW